MSQDRATDWAALVGGFGVALIGFAVVVTQAYRLWPFRDAASWPTTTGTVTMSSLAWQDRTGERFPEPAAGGTADHTGMKLVADIAYTYVARWEYTATRVTADNTGHPREVVARFNAGDTVTVYYDPNNHWRAVLVPGFTARAIAPVAFSAVVGFFGLGMGIVMIRHMARTRARGG